MKKLIAFDMDGVIFEHHNFWMELHKAFGTLEEGIALTKQYVKTNYDKLVQEVIGRLWKDKPAKPYFDLIANHKYVDGANETFKALKRNGHTTMLITSGPYDLALRAKNELGVDYIFANRLPIESGKVVGTSEMGYWKIRDDRKVEPLEEIRANLKIDGRDVIAVIHDKNDIKLAKHVKEIGGEVIGFMFEPHPEVEENCTKIVRSANLTDILVHIN